MHGFPVQILIHICFKGGLISESFFTLAQLFKKKVPKDLTQIEKLSEIKQPLNNKILVQKE